MTFWLMQAATTPENPPSNDPYVSGVQAQPAFCLRRPTFRLMQVVNFNILVNVKGIKDKQDACPT
ncbi:MAG: hypothetical protein JEZ07_05390 [Phycisphaerae bacterium]|nr:hypothetical protein [Phycisphaerae bacterium]